MAADFQGAGDLYFNVSAPIAKDGAVNPGVFKTQFGLASVAQLLECCPMLIPRRDTKLVKVQSPGRAWTRGNQLMFQSPSLSLPLSLKAVRNIF